MRNCHRMAFPSYSLQYFGGLHVSILTTMRKTLLILLASAGLAGADDSEIEYQLEMIGYQLEEIQARAVQDLKPDSGSTGPLYGIDVWIWGVRYHTWQCLKVMADHNWDARILINNPDLKVDAEYLTRDYGFTKEQVGEEILKAAAEYWNMDREQARRILFHYIRQAYIPVKRAIPVNKGGISFGR